ncbi:HAMP domain-containing sensor histidine kinase [Actinocorallia longicatena]|uniref:histidine kinase n=1 Tax=Actinocorallia longicatena TaxID=111803 RepID=A0ABP6QJY5_9ACTN
MRRLPLRGRLALLTAVAVAIAVAACAVASWFLVRGQLYDQLDKQLVARSGIMPPPPGEDGGGLPQRNMISNQIIVAAGTCTQELQTRPEGWPYGPGDDQFMQVLNEDGGYCTAPGKGKIAVTAEDKAVAEGTSARSIGNSTGTSIDGTSTDLRVLTQRVTLDVIDTEGKHARKTYTVMTGMPLDQVTAPLGNLALTLLAVSALGVLGAAFAGLLIARAALKPVDGLTDAVEDIARTEDLSVKIPEEGTDEIARLGRSFNTMTAALAASQERQRNLIADAGHELRTPLTSMKTNIELLIKSQNTGRDLPPDVKERLLASVKAQMQELTTLIGDLLQLGSPAAKRREVTEVPLHEVARRAVERARLRGPGLTVTARLDPWYVRGDADTLERAVVNLCDNAVKFSPSGGVVEVRLEGGALTVRDQGPGIPEDELPYVFERFWRSPSARSLPGSGLGLSIVAQIAEEAGGKVALEPVPGGGTLARLELPGARTAS